MKKKLIVLSVFLLATTIYFVFYHKDNTFTIAPVDADVIVLVDAKKFTRQYIYHFATHPSRWFEDKNKNTISLKESGVKIPDFLQVFHLKNSKFSDWYSVFELNDEQKFTAFLKQQRYLDQGNNVFKRNQTFIKLLDKNCIVGTSDSGFASITDQLFWSSRNNILAADELITHGLGTVVLFNAENGSQSLSIHLNADEIEIKNNSDSYDPPLIISKLQRTKPFLEAKLDKENIRKFTSFFYKTLSDSSYITYFKVAVELEQVNDTIVTYGYDDNFNEVEKKSIQKIIQPNYVFALKSSNIEKTQRYFRDKKWINAQNQFTAIPFQPNLIKETKTGFHIQSTGKQISLPTVNGNYIFVRNNAFLSSSFKSLTAAEKKIISGLDYIFYGNNDQNYYLKLKFKKEELPLILRW